jgi:desulfoferrodoxin-like iron-binding protein
MSQETMYKHLPVITEGEEKGGPEYIVVAGEDGSLEAEHLHPQTDAHHIAAIYIKDENGKILFYKDLEHGSSGEKAKTYFVFPRMVEKNAPKVFVPYQYCNLHGLWEGVRVGQ